MKAFTSAALATVGGIMFVAWLVWLSMDFGLGPGLIFPSNPSNLWEMGLYYPLTYGVPLVVGALLYIARKISIGSKV